MNLNFDINIGGRLELLDSSVVYAEEMILELGFGNTSYTNIIYIYHHNQVIFSSCIMIHYI